MELAILAQVTLIQIKKVSLARKKPAMRPLSSSRSQESALMLAKIIKF
jgi:hypothetical protein